MNGCVTYVSKMFRSKCVRRCGAETSNRAVCFKESPQPREIAGAEGRRIQIGEITIPVKTAGKAGSIKPPNVLALSAHSGASVIPIRQIQIYRSVF